MARARMLTAAAVLLGSGLLLVAQAPGQEFKGQVKIGKHEVKLEAGKFYEIILDGPKDLIHLRVPDARLLMMMAKDIRDDRYFFLPAVTNNYTVFVMPDFVTQQNAAIDYTVKFKETPLAKKPLLEVKDKWTNADPLYKKNNWDKAFKPYKVEMKAGKVYLIDLVKNQDGLDPYLFLEDSTGNIVASDDDSGGNLNARIVYSPTQNGEFVIIATTLNNAMGEFMLTVRQSE